jgi:hypothetical protein
MIEVEKWNNIYLILFPDVNLKGLPNPYESLSFALVYDIVIYYRL